jgi:hypothetical protein
MEVTPPELEEREAAERVVSSHERAKRPALAIGDRPRLRRALLIAMGGMLLLLAATFFYYRRIGHVIDERLGQGPFAGTMNVFGAPQHIAPGDGITTAELIADLTRSGYSTRAGDAGGWFAADRNSVSITPCPGIGADTKSCVIAIAQGKVSRIEAEPSIGEPTGIAGAASGQSVG